MDGATLWRVTEQIRKILVIGSSGFVGRRVAQALLAAGYAVRCLARNPAKVRDLAAPGCEVVQGDISDRASMQLPWSPSTWPIQDVGPVTTLRM